MIIQKTITNVSVSGVIFNYELNTGAPYYVINYDDKTEKLTQLLQVIQNTLIEPFLFLEIELMKSNQNDGRKLFLA